MRELKQRLNNVIKCKKAALKIKFPNMVFTVFKQNFNNFLTN